MITTTPTAGGEQVQGRSRRREVAAPLAIAAVAFAARLVPVLRGGGLYGLGGYDDGVHFAAALGLVHGRLPYRDFLLLHPPGIVIALAPFAALAAIIGDPNAFAVARVAFMLLGAGNTVLAWHILRPIGRSAAVIGAGAYAVFYPAVYAEHSTLLEGFANAAVLGAVLIMTRTLRHGRWVGPALGAGALLGLSASTKIWGVVPAAVIFGWCALRGDVRRGSALLAGVGLGATAVCLPFFVAAPTTMWRYVVSDQLGRPHLGGPMTRLATVLGLNVAGLGHPIIVGAAALLPITAAVLAWRSGTGRLAVLLLVADGILLCTTPPFFQHYAALTAAPLVLVLGAAAPPVARQLQGRRRQAAAVAGLAVAAGLMAVPTFTSTYGRTFPASAISAAVTDRGGCVTSDDPTTLIETGALSENLRRGCPLVVDLGGYNYDLQPANGYLSRPRNPRWQQHALAYLRSGTTTIVARFSHQPGFDAPTRRAVHAWRVIMRAPTIIVRGPS